MTVMGGEQEKKPKLEKAVPFFWVSNIEASVKYYVEGLGFEMKSEWIDAGKLQWCWLDNGGASLMLQEFTRVGDQRNREPVKRGEGVSICFICKDALTVYHDMISRGIAASEPFVGNRMWVTGVNDPDGYILYFESYTDVPEETRYSDWVSANQN